jgi:hypothetical protein
MVELLVFKTLDIAIMKNLTLLFNGNKITFVVFR